MAAYQMALAFTEDASQDIETMLRREPQVCAIHRGTTLDFGVCDLCEVTTRPATSPWVTRAAEARLPYKVHR